MNTTVDPGSLHKFFGRQVNINVDTGCDDTGASTFKTLTGRVAAASVAGIVLRLRGTTIIVEPEQILDIEEVEKRRRRIIRRFVREIGIDASAKQHLADRHGILVSVLNEVDEDVARQMHEAIKHDDLGHQHGDRRSGTFVDPDEAETAIEELNSEFDNEDDSDGE